MVCCIKTFIWIIVFCASASFHASAEQWVSMGSGKILVGAKAGHERPKDAVYRTEEMMQKALPTNSWFSSLTYMQWSGVLHAHPLSFKATASGFESGVARESCRADSRRLRPGLGPHLPADLLRALYIGTCRP